MWNTNVTESIVDICLPTSRNYRHSDSAASWKHVIPERWEDVLFLNPLCFDCSPSPSRLTGLSSASSPSPTGTRDGGSQTLGHPSTGMWQAPAWEHRNHKADTSDNVKTSQSHMSSYKFEWPAQLWGRSGVSWASSQDSWLPSRARPSQPPEVHPCLRRVSCWACVTGRMEWMVTEMGAHRGPWGQARPWPHPLVTCIGGAVDRSWWDCPADRGVIREWDDLGIAVGDLHQDSTAAGSDSPCIDSVERGVYEYLH